MNIGQSADKSFAYLLGVYLGDASIAPDSTYRLETMDVEFAQRVKAEIEALKGKSIAPINPYRTLKSGITIHRVMGYLGVYGRAMRDETNLKAIIPTYVHGWSKECKSLFIVGIMDSDGFVCKGKQNTAFQLGYASYKPWVAELRDIFMSVGLSANAVKAHGRDNRFSIKKESWIKRGFRFTATRKQSRVNEWAKLISETTRQALGLWVKPSWVMI